MHERIDFWHASVLASNKVGVLPKRDAILCHKSVRPRGQAKAATTYHF
jgi:hypothetical protein